jgi:hypothetical protein
LPHASGASQEFAVLLLPLPLLPLTLEVPLGAMSSSCKRLIDVFFFLLPFVFVGFLVLFVCFCWILEKVISPDEVDIGWFLLDVHLCPMLG